MLSQLTTLKTRLAITETDVQYDDLLNTFLAATSARLDRECNRTFARTVNATYEFDPNDVEIISPIFPIESVSKFELKENETEGWVEQTDVEFVIRKSRIISLESALRPATAGHSAITLARITYTGGYVLPGSTASPGQTALPADLEQAAVEQAAVSFLRRDRIGLEINWDKGGAYQRLSQLPLLPSVAAILSRYRRISL
jgi:hypothetical protein